MRARRLRYQLRPHRLRGEHGVLSEGGAGGVRARLAVLDRDGEEAVAVAGLHVMSAMLALALGLTRSSCKRWLSLRNPGWTHLFKAFPLRGSSRLFSGIAPSFRQEPVPVAAVVTEHDALRGDVEDGYAAADGQVVRGEVGDYRRRGLRMRRHGARGSMATGPLGFYSGGGC